MKNMLRNVRIALCLTIAFPFAVVGCLAYAIDQIMDAIVDKLAEIALKK